MTSPALTVQPTTTIKEAARIMTDHRISALPVVSATGELTGIVSEADLIALETMCDPRAQLIPVPPHRQLTPSTVGEVMTVDVVTCEEETDIGLVAQRMLDAHVKRLPVMRGRRVIGIISRQDLLRVIAEDDSAIRDAVRELLARESQGLGCLSVSVRDGVVELGGEADATTLKLAESVAGEVPGVLAVKHRAAAR